MRWAPRAAGSFTSSPSEGYLLAGSGCCIGLLLAYCAVSLLPGLIPPRLLDNMPYLQHLHLNAHIVLFALMISTVGGILFSAAPALQLFLSDTLAGLRDGGRTVSRSWRKMGSGLVAAELAITVVLLVSALLLAKSFYRLLHEDIGISADHLAVLHVLDPDASTDAQQISTDQQVLHRIRALPGVTSVGTSNELAVDDGERFKFSFEHFRVAGKSYIGEGDEASRRSVSVGYFETLVQDCFRDDFLPREMTQPSPWWQLSIEPWRNKLFSGKIHSERAS